MSDYKALSMEEQIALQQEVTQLTALLALADAWAKMHQEANDELAAHVQRLRDAWSKLQIITYHGEMTPEDRDECDSVFSMEPAQSLQAIRAEVEEEVIGRCIDKLRDIGVMVWYDYRGEFKNMPRKYS